MPSLYGFTQEEWGTARKQMLQILQRVASQQLTISYGELSSKLPIWLDPHSQAMAAMLGEVSEEEEACCRGMISAVVVHKEGDMRPGEGFFKYASELGRDVSDRDSMWVAELQRVYASWQRQPALPS
jgi:hypothetical protein